MSFRTFNFLSLEFLVLKYGCLSFGQGEQLRQTLVKISNEVDPNNLV